MSTVARAKARRAGTPLPSYPKPADWVPHFVAVVTQTK